MINPNMFNSGSDFLIFVVGGAFLLVVIMRILHKKERELEVINSFDLPLYFSKVIIIIELILGILLTFNLVKNKENIKKLLLLGIIIMFIGTVLVLYNNFDKIKKSFIDAFFYKSDTITVFIHLTYIFIMISILIDYKVKYNI
jgi:hypothetical protein